MNAAEQQARFRKATRIADLLQAGEITAAQMADAGELSWKLAAQAAQTTPASEQTRAMVLQMLEARAATKAALDEAGSIGYVVVPRGTGDLRH